MSSATPERRCSHRLPPPVGDVYGQCDHPAGHDGVHSHHPAPDAPTLASLAETPTPSSDGFIRDLPITWDDFTDPDGTRTNPAPGPVSEFRQPSEPWMWRDRATLDAWTTLPAPLVGRPSRLRSWWLRVKRRIAARVMDWADWEDE
jgi:hypothetical protein